MKDIKQKPFVELTAQELWQLLNEKKEPPKNKQEPAPEVKKKVEPKAPENFDINGDYSVAALSKLL